MPPKANRSSVIHIRDDDLELSCEWQGCQQTFQSMDVFMAHVTEHLNIHYSLEQKTAGESEDLHCLWRECGTEIEGDPSDYVRHVYFHTFHVKIKAIGALLMERSGQRPCSLVTQSSRNLIPELPERLECGWEHCHFMFENAELFYRHVENHGDSFPEGNHVKNGCKCGWDGCEVRVKSKHKLKDHLRSHTQEKLVACPTCGALFSSRTKFFDHLHRQVGGYTGKRYQCSHCNRTFASERLLRDHMRNHVNQYKCPYCDMTSPSPSCLRLHIRYRHTEDKPYKCDFCDHSCKSSADLKKHMDIHNDEDVYHCQVTDCKYSARGYQSLTNHYKYHHQTSSYECHICNCEFARGTLLTKHLKNSHDFSWPSGHSRFRYKLHSDGMYRLQTVRYETVQLATQAGEQSADSTADPSMSVSVADRAPEAHTEANGNMETFDALIDQKHETLDISFDDGVLVINGQNESQSKPSSGKFRKGKKRYMAEDSAKSKQTKVLTDMSNAEEEVSDSEEGVKISITLDQDGNCFLKTDNMLMDEKVPMSLPASQKIEENMYNLQMLGEVALQNQTNICIENM